MSDVKKELLEYAAELAGVEVREVEGPPGRLVITATPYVIWQPNESLDQMQLVLLALDSRQRLQVCRLVDTQNHFCLTDTFLCPASVRFKAFMIVIATTGCNGE